MLRNCFQVFLLLLSFSALAQIDSSSCHAPDSIIEKYVDDADRLALRRVIRNDLVYVDSAEIPQGMSDTVLNALIAVYNATSLPARDTVVDFLNIHTRMDPFMDDFTVSVSTSLPWAQNFIQGNLPTGNSSIDSLIDLYNVAPVSLGFSPVRCFTDSNYNLLPILNAFENIYGVIYAEANSVIGIGGNDITDSIHADHVALTYRYGTVYFRYYEFKVYFDCTVEYMGSHGDFNWPTGINDPEDQRVEVWPNPFVNSIYHSDLPAGSTYQLFNLTGSLVRSGQTQGDRIEDLGALPSGYYTLLLRADGIIHRHKLIKE